MKRVILVVALLWLALLPCALAQGPDDQYVRIYNLIQQADALNEAGQISDALGKYLEAQSELKKFKNVYPDWNSKVVNFRLSYLARRIAPLAEKTKPPEAEAPSKAAPEPAVPTTVTPVKPDAETQRTIEGLRQQVQQLEAARILLEAKLKEALSVQPAAVDSRELAKAEERIRELQKQNELLSASLEEEKGRVSKLADPAQLEQARQSLAEANRKLAEQTDTINTLQKEKGILQKQAEANAAAAGALAALREENEVLKRRLADVSTRPEADTVDVTPSRQLQQALARVAALQSDLEILRLEKTALENRVRTLSTGTVTTTALPAAPTPEEATRIKQLEQEKEELSEQLDAATKELYGRDAKATAARMEEINKQLAALRARVDVFEAKAVPYTAEELALFQKPSPAPVAADPNAGKKPVRELPPGTGTLVAEAQRAFAAQRFDEAETKYLEVLRQDEKNVYTLANLAAIQVEQNKLGEAEKNLKRALEIEPDDAFALSLFGYLKYLQGNLDEALDALSRSAKLNPQNADTQNYLGIVLIEKGMRGPAETAFRKAIQLNSGYASAHVNLAVIYITQRPPLVELSRWHYEKARGAGHPRKPDLEKLIEETRSSQGTP